MRKEKRKKERKLLVNESSRESARVGKTMGRIASD